MEPTSKSLDRILLLILIFIGGENPTFILFFLAFSKSTELALNSIICGFLVDLGLIRLANSADVLGQTPAMS